MQKLIILLFISILFIRCASTKQNRASRLTVEKQGAQITLDANLARGEMMAWFVYGGKRAQWIDSIFFLRYPNDSLYRYTFQEEYEARNDMIEDWNKLKGRLLFENNDYLAKLTMVKNAGYLKEYIWNYHNDSTWQLPESLQIAVFTKWDSLNLPNHKPQTRAKISNQSMSKRVRGGF